jgi:maltose O-acetyltransferase
MSGVTVGPGAVVGAGSIVTHDCDAHGLYVGTPARWIRDLPMTKT